MVITVREVFVTMPTMVNTSYHGYRCQVHPGAARPLPPSLRHKHNPTERSTHLQQQKQSRLRQAQGENCL